MTEPTPETSWKIGSPTWAGALDRPLFRVFENADDDPDPDTLLGLLLLPLMYAWFLVGLVLTLVEAAVHTLLINPIRRLCRPTVRRAGWTIDVRHIEPIDPSQLPEYKRGVQHETHTTTTLWVARKSTAKHLDRQLEELLTPELTLTDPPIRAVLDAAHARVMGSRSAQVP